MYAFGGLRRHTRPGNGNDALPSPRKVLCRWRSNNLHVPGGEVDGVDCVTARVNKGEERRRGEGDGAVVAACWVHEDIRALASLKHGTVQEDMHLVLLVVDQPKWRHRTALQS